jgi:hypothetical protein
MYTRLSQRHWQSLHHLQTRFLNVNNGLFKCELRIRSKQSKMIYKLNVHGQWKPCFLDILQANNRRPFIYGHRIYVIIRCFTRSNCQIRIISRTQDSGNSNPDIYSQIMKQQLISLIELPLIIATSSTSI